MSTYPESGDERPRRRGRPAKIGREAIIDAAIDLGIDRFSMQAVADRLGVTAPALYSHVTGRDEVVALAGIRHGLDAGGVERPKPTAVEEYASFLNADLWLLLAVASFWTTVLCVAVPRLRGRPAGEANQWTRVGALTVLALCVPGLWGGRSLAARAVVRRAEVSLRLTPTQFGEPLRGVAEGDVVRTERPLNGHVRVRTADGKTGWVRAGEIEAVRGPGLPADLEQKAAP